MEEDQEQEHIKHVCKFCNKSFPCGRSLGGHMRSHVTNFSTESEKMKKLSSLNNEETTGSEGGYGLRENPKKTWRLTNSSEEKETGLVAVLDKLCNECGRGFQSWKALFGHMKCHSDKEKVILDDDHQEDSWNKVVMNDSQSQSDDNEVNVPPNRRRRSKRKRTRYMKTTTTTTTTTSVTSSVSVSEIEHEYEYEQEQEEVAISLMMLSRDVSNWSGLNSIGESSYQNISNSLQLETVSKIESKRVISNGSELGNSNGKSSEILVTDSPKNDDRLIKMKQKRVYGKDKKSEIDSESELVVSKSNSKYTSKKSKFFDSEKKSNSLESEISKKSHKKGKFECTTCKKKFHSYQALGGHRANHKRNKGCFPSKIESSENTNEFEEVDPTIESNELMKNIEYVEEEHEQLEAVKKSNLVSELESQSQRVMVEESLPEIRNFLDLNLPATTDEENISNQHAEIYKPWWLVGSNHKQEGLVALFN